MNAAALGACPASDDGDRERIVLAHGEGGRLSRRLVAELAAPIFDNPPLRALGDSAQLPPIKGRLALTTDSFVVSPLFFPGGDIGKLAVCGSVNDLCVAGALPRWLTLSLIIEEGLPIEVLRRVLRSAAEAARAAGVAVVAGDTKVVPKGAADRLFVTTAGVGEIGDWAPPGPAALQPGDQLIVSGPIGRHGVAVLAEREQLGFDPKPVSDCASVAPLTAALRDAGIPCRALRDPTRGGVAAVLHEWAAQAQLTMTIEESQLPVSADVRGVCELLGLDPIHSASEGSIVAAVPAVDVDAALAALRAVPMGAEAARVGEAAPQCGEPVVVARAVGRLVPLDEPMGAPMPRIC